MESTLHGTILEGLLEATSELSFARELPQVTAIIRTAARRLTDADGVTFVLKEDDQCFYVDENAIAPLWKGRRFPLESCISGWVMRHRQPVAISDVYKDSRIPHDVYRPTFVRSLLMVPVQADDPIAAIGAYWTTEHIATTAEVTVLEALARAAALALLNVQLWADLQRSREASAAQAAELEHLNRQLRLRVSEFETLLNVLPIGIGIATDPGGEDIRTNRAFTEMLRLAPAHNASLSAPEPDRPKHFRMFRDNQLVEPRDLPLQTAAREGTEIRGLELEIEFDTGDRRQFLEYAAPLFDESGGLRGSVGAFIDVTDQRQQAAALLAAERAAREEAERASRIKDEFLASLSHELRTPLNAILGWTQLLRQRHDPPDFLLRGLETLERNAKLQTQLIEDLLDMSRILSGRIRLDRHPINLSTIVEAAVESVQPGADAKQLRLLTLVEPDLPPVLGDPIRLEQVVWNLLTNALKFSQPGGTVEVLLRLKAQHVEISVTDSGAGIAPAFLPHVFERFRQADASTTRTHGGLGIGLSIVKHLVELHGGHVEAASAGEGCGATFTVSLPIVRSADDALAFQDEVFDRDAARPSLSTVSVLVVDDDEDSRELVEEILRQSGALVTTAARASEALSLLATFHPDAIVSDIGLPGEDGYEFIRRVRGLGGQHQSIPALALTAFARPEDREKALAAGFQMHIAKPVEPTVLVTALARLCSIEA
jgi:signal transduction histidine kinase/ActR/RegA family two-component response regulator